MGLLKMLGMDDETRLREANERLEQSQRWRARRDLAEGKTVSHTVSQPVPGSGNGGATKIALLNMLSTSDLDQVMADCAPSHTQAVFNASNMAQANNMEIREMRTQMATDQNFRELQGKYTELEAHYKELQNQYNPLIAMLAQEHVGGR